jgi:hypothetical protein
MRLPAIFRVDLNSCAPVVDGDKPTKIGVNCNQRGFVMQSSRTFLIALILVRVAFGQASEAELKSKVAEVLYPQLAKQARIQGDVHLSVAAGMVTVLSGHPLLAPIAVESAKSVGSIEGRTSVDMTYHFVLADNATSVPTWVTVKRGNGFERTILRMFGRKTEKVVLEYRCQSGDAPENDRKVFGATIDIWIYRGGGCLQTEAAELLARR